MSRKKDVRETAAETTHTAVDRGQAILEAAVEALSPLLDQAQDVAKDYVAPVAETAKDRLSPLADQARHTAVSKVAPLAATAAAGGAKLAHDAKEQLTPRVATLAGVAAPAVGIAKDKVNDDLVPQLVDLLRQAENHPALNEAGKRGRATAAALRGELELPEKKERSVAGTVAKAAAVTAVIGAVAVAVRQFLATKDDAWTAHQPSAAYVNEAQDDEAAGQDAADQAKATDPAAAEWVDRSQEQDLPTADAQPVEEPVAAADVDSEPDPDELMSAEGGPVAEAETTNEDLAVLNEYGEGSYVGEEPPSEFTIKGNERSMKFHTDDSAGYERTIADVWFNSVEAAEKAGFTRAQR